MPEPSEQEPNEHASREEPRQKPRRWFQFGLSTLLVVTALAAGGAMAWRVYVEPYRHQREAMAVIEKLLAVATRDAAGTAVLALWDTKSLKKTRLFYGHNKAIWSVCFSSDGKLIASAALDKLAKIWDVKHGDVMWTLDGNPDTVDFITFHPKSQTVAYECGDGTFHVSELGKPIRKVLSAKRDAISSLAFHPDGKHLFCGGFDRSKEGPIVSTVQVWDVAARKMVSETQASPFLPVTSLAFSADGKQVLTTSHDGVTRLWKFTAGALRSSKDKAK